MSKDDVVTALGYTPADQEDVLLKGEVDGRNRLENSLNPVIGTYAESIVHVEKNVNVTEWTANDAIRIYGSKGNNDIIALINDGAKSIPVGSSLCTSVYIKNNGKYNIHFSDQVLASYKTIPSKGIGKYYVSRKIDGSTYLAQLLFAMEDSGDFDFIIWHPKIEFGDTPTDWTPAPEDVVVRSELEKKIGSFDWGIEDVAVNDCVITERLGHVSIAIYAVLPNPLSSYIQNNNEVTLGTVKGITNPSYHIRKIVATQANHIYDKVNPCYGIFNKKGVITIVPTVNTDRSFIINIDYDV